jgi:cupin fold WbuC family metalloprotein
MIKINQELLQSQEKKAAESPRKRAMHIFHKTMDDTLQRMINTMQPGTYLRPHKHEDPDKREVFIVLTGKFVIIEFDDEGNIRDHMVLDPKTNQFAAEIDARVFHSVICLGPNSTAYELKDGPYNPIDDKNWASWAPKEGDVDCDDYNQKLLQQLNIKAEY